MEPYTDASESRRESMTTFATSSACTPPIGHHRRDCATRCRQPVELAMTGASSWVASQTVLCIGLTGDDNDARGQADSFRAIQGITAPRR
jgi:hypothetical protein